MGIFDFFRKKNKQMDSMMQQATTLIYYEPRGCTQLEALHFLTNSPKGITFIHGKAGCGKTYLIKKVESSVAGCQVLTPTNLAASLYRGARTLHSFFYGCFDDLEEGFQNPQNLNDSRCASLAQRIRHLSMLIIDEISMVRADTFEMMNQICQKCKGNLLPFGGIPVVLVGDMFQLPPIVSDEAVLSYLKKEYGGIYFFNSHIIQQEIKNIKLFELTKSYRQQNDPEYVRILDRFRRPLSSQDKMLVLDALNSRVTNSYPKNAVYVASSNEEVKQVNTKKLNELPGDITTLDATYQIQKIDGNGYVTIKHSDLPADEEIHKIIVPSQYDTQLSFKRGARVMFCKNSKSAGYMNGNFGTIIDFNGTYFTIKLEEALRTVMCPAPNDRYKASQLNEYRYEMSYDEEQHKLVRIKPYIQKTTQYPIKLAYAFTIHKSQGQTYDEVIIDLNSHIFAPGQLYVALSRVKSLNGLYLTKPIKYSDIITDDSIFEFLNVIRSANGNCDKVLIEMSQTELYTNPSCDRIYNEIVMQETDQSTKECLLHILSVYKTLICCQEYEKAFLELQKLFELLASSYQVGDYNLLFDAAIRPAFTEESCQHTLDAIYDIYIKAVKSPKKQYITDHHVVTFNLSLAP